MNGLVGPLQMAKPMSWPAIDKPTVTIENYRIDGLRPSKKLIEFGSPRPNAGEGLAVRGHAPLNVMACAPRTGSKAEFGN